MVRTSPLKSLYHLTFSAVNQTSRSFCRDDRAVSRPKKTDERVPPRDAPATATRNLDVAVAQWINRPNSNGPYAPTVLSTREALAGLMAWRKSLRRDASVARQDPDRHAFRRRNKTAFGVMLDRNKLAYDTVVVLHNDAVVQGLSDRPVRNDVKRWGVLTIGTGLGNAQFTNRRGDEDWPRYEPPAL
jgi:hypothetical protein